MKILLVASDPMEFRGLPRRQEFLCVSDGAGAHRAAAAVDAAMATFAADVIVNMGFCGALDPSLAIADIVVGTTILAGHRHFAALSPTVNRPCRSGAVCSIDRVASTVEEKSRLRGSGAIAVEMEAGGVAGRAQSLGLPFYCIKAVTDLAGETMANDFNAALRSDGRFDTINILASSFRKPRARIPELLRFRRRCIAAARSLGEFIADCRF